MEVYVDDKVVNLNSIKQEVIGLNENMT